MKRNITLQLLSLFFIFQFSIFISQAQPCIPNPNSIDFNGVSSFVRINSLNSLEITNQLTIEAWIYPKAFASSATGGSIVCKHAWGSSMYGFVLRCGGSGQLSFNLAGAVGGSPVGWQEALSNPGALVLNTWQHVAATFDGAMLQLYINGSPAGNFPFTGTINPSTGYKVRIGALADTVWGMSRYFTGNIDEVRIWDRALAPSEIVAGMNDHIDPGTQIGLVGYYRFNEGGGFAVADLGTGNNNASMVNGTWSTSVPFNNNTLPTPTISWVSPNLVSSYTTGNQWYFGTTLLTGATQQTYHPTQYGNYKVVVTDTNGCTAVSALFNYNTTGISDPGNSSFTLQPNPAKDYISISLPEGIQSANCTIYSLTGEQVITQKLNQPATKLSLTNLSPGLYFIQLISGSQVFTSKVVIAK